jgi:thymidylate synthase (FAD)
MKIVEPSFTILRPANTEEGILALKFIESMARISHRSESGQTEDSYKRFIENVCVKRGDWSVAEHSSATVIFTIDRGMSHQLVRHRLFSFTQESTRFVRYKEENQLEFIRPADKDTNQNWLDSLATAEWTYFELLRKGRKPQEARSVLPNALATRIAVTGNYRVWRSFFLARTTQETQEDFRKVTIPLLAEFQNRIPILFQDIVPGEKQSVAFSKPR